MEAVCEGVNRSGTGRGDELSSGNGAQHAQHPRDAACPSPHSAGKASHHAAAIATAPSPQPASVIPCTTAQLHASGRGAEGGAGNLAGQHQCRRQWQQRTGGCVFPVQWPTADGKKLRQLAPSQSHSQGQAGSSPAPPIRPQGSSHLPRPRPLRHPSAPNLRSQSTAINQSTAHQTVPINSKHSIPEPST